MFKRVFSLGSSVCLLSLCIACNKPGEAGMVGDADVAAALTVPLRTSKVLLVPVEIQGKTYHFMLDTGATYTAIDAAVASKITAIMPHSELPSYFQDRIRGGLVNHDAPIASNDVIFLKPVPLKIGPFVITTPEYWTQIDLKLLTEHQGQTISGILGSDVFRQLNWHVNNKNKTLTINRGAPQNARLSGYCAPYFDNAGAMPSISIDVGDTSAQVQIDTGSLDSLVPTDLLPLLREHKVTVEETGSSYAARVTGLVETKQYAIDGLQFANLPMGKLAITTTNFPSLLLGMNFLERFDDYTFIPGSMLLCFNRTQFSRDDVPPVRNVGVAAQGGKVMFAYNVAATLKDIDIQDGDQLLSVNGVAADIEHINDIREKLTTAPVGSLTIVLQRAGVEKTVHF